MVFWGIEVKPGKPQAYNPENEQGKLHLTQATLGAGLGKEKSVIQCSIGGNAPVYLCSLLPNKSECCPLNLEFDYNDEAVEFSVTGGRSIHLSGFLQAYDEEECEQDDDEDDSDGIDIGDTESGESEYDSEEDEDQMDEFEDFIDHNLDMYRQSSVPNSGVVIEEIEDEEKPAKDDKTKRSKKKSQASKDESANKQIVVKESAHAPVLESEDEDGLPIPKEKTPEPEKNSAAKMDVDDDEQGSNKKRKAKAPEQESVNKNKKKKNQKEKKNEEADEKVETGKVETSQSSSNPKAQNGAVNNAMSESSKTPVQSSEKKNKKKKKSNEEAKEESKAISSRTYPNGLVVEEMKMGKPNGKKATPGKQVMVSYTGKLKNGEVFDSNKNGFEFRLGVGQVIKGWDVGVNGMRIGDKRKLTIPPSMGYGARGAGGDIPPNAWLTFDVELLDVK
ncbi:hypothetical protein Bca101_079335 [Brassica carinata]